MKFIYLNKVDSTNKYAKEHLESLEHFSVVYTPNQTNGRGRFNRTWVDLGSKNIYATIALKPNSDFKEVYSNLTQYLCVVLSKIFEEYGVKPTIKWPNDIRINKKKISGILAESIIEHNKLQGIIIGFGVNLNSTVESLENINQSATSLNIEVGKEIDRDEFLTKLISKFCLGYNKFIEEGFLSIREDYIKRAEFIGEEITVKVLNKEVTGKVETITNNGALKLSDKDNNELILLIGDIL